MSDRPEKLYLSAPDADQEHQICFDPDEGGTEYIRADIYAALEAQLAETVKVKPLEWVSGATPDKQVASVFGKPMYEVGKKSGGHYWMHNWSGLHIEGAASLEAAKSAAQADYERRILSALEATPPAPKVTEEDWLAVKQGGVQDMLTALTAAQESGE